MKSKMGQFSVNLNLIFSVARDGTVLYSNEAGESLLHEWGVEIGEKLPSTFGDLVQRVISLNSPEKLEVKVGNRVYLIVFDPVLNEECVNISGFEICDQNEFEEKLQESERRYHLLFENMLDGFAYCKLLYDDFGHPIDFIYLDTNRAFEQLTGLKKVNGKRATEVFPGIKESHPELLEIYNRVASTGKPEKFEIEFKPLGIWLSISVYSTEKEHFIAVFDNVTESKRAEKALQESEEKYRIVANNTSDWEFWMDLNGHFLYTSPSCERVTGYAAREFMDNPDLLQEIIYPDDRQAVLQHRHDMPSSRHGDIEFRIVTKNGEIRWIHHLCQSLYDGEGCYAGSRGSNRDITGRKRVEEALIESEQHYRLLYETMLQGVIYQDANGKIVSMNPAAEKILGKIPAEFVGSSSVGEEYLTIRENGSPFPGLEHPAMVSLRTGRKVQNVVMGVYNPREKRYRWININAVPIFRAGEDKPFQVYSLFDDITERKQAEEMLAFERAQLLSIFDGIDDAVYVTDPYTYEVLYANKAMKDKFGGELVGGICYRKFQERDSPCDFCTNPIILKERGKPYHWEYYNHTVDRYFMIMDRFIKWPDGRDVRFEIAKDITDRKRTEETLRESEEKYRNLIETTNEGVWIFNSVSETTYVNEKMAKMLGYSREEMVGSFIWDYADEEDKGVFQVKLANRKQGIDEVYELKLMRKEGSYVWLLVSAKAFFDKDGKFAGSLGMFTDITERKYAEEALKKAHDSLEAEVKQRTQELEKAYSSLKVSEKKYRNIIETANEGIAIIDSKGIITYANKRLWDMLGYSTA